MKQFKKKSYLLLVYPVGHSGKKKQLFNKKKPPGVLGSWRGSSLLQPAGSEKQLICEVRNNMKVEEESQ